MSKLAPSKASKIAFSSGSFSITEYSCSRCGLRCSTQPSLLRHLRRAHDADATAMVIASGLHRVRNFVQERLERLTKIGYGAWLRKVLEKLQSELVILKKMQEDDDVLPLTGVGSGSVLRKADDDDNDAPEDVLDSVVRGCGANPDQKTARKLKLLKAVVKRIRSSLNVVKTKRRGSK